MDRINLAEKIPELFRKYRYALVILLIGLVLMMLPSGEKSESDEVAAPTEESSMSIETQLETLLEQMKGAGKVKVMLTVSAGSETIYQTDNNQSQTSDSSSERGDTVIISNDSRGEEGLVRQVNPPQYLGALILCQGGDDPNIRLSIVEAVSKLTGLGADKICVLKMK